MIEIRHLAKEYNNNGTVLKVLRDVNCTIQKGEVISIIGPSGTGKSTLLRCMNRLEEPSGGQIIIDGQDILATDANLPLLRRKMGMVFQSFNLFGHLTILENVMCGPVKLLGMSKSDAREQAMDLLRMVGMAEKADAMPSDLSGGQRQRVAIARCLSMKPEIILFDEPTSALDPTMVSEVLSVIRRLAKQGMTMAIVTHEMKFARNVSSRIFFMYDGIIYEDGTPDQIFGNPQKPITQAFINRIRTLELTAKSRDFDLYRMNADIEQFCQKYSLDEQVAMRLELVLEEMLTGVLPLDGPVDIKVDYSEKNYDLFMEFVSRAGNLPVLSSVSTDNLSFKVIQGSCLDIQQTGNCIRLKIRK